MIQGTTALAAIVLSFCILHPEYSNLSTGWLNFLRFWLSHDNLIKWKHFPRHWPFVRGIHWWPVNSPHKGQRRRTLMFSLICAWRNGWVNNFEAGDSRRHRAHYDITVMSMHTSVFLHTPLYPCPSGWTKKTDDNRLDLPGPRLCAAFCLNCDLFIVFSLLTFAVMLIFIKHWKLIINDVACTDKSTHDYSFISDV